MKYLISALGSVEQSKKIYPYIDSYIVGTIKIKKASPIFLLPKSQYGGSEYQYRNSQYIYLRWPIQLFKRARLLWILFIWPFALLRMLIILMSYKIKENTQTVVCLTLKDFLCMTPVAHLLRYTVIWVDDGTFVGTDRRSVYCRLYKKLSKYVDIITPTEYLKNELHTIGVDEERIHVLYPTIDLTITEATRLPHSFTLSTVVSLDYDTGINTLVKVIGMVREFIPGIELLVIGKGEERKALLWIIRRMGLEQCVKIVNESETISEWVQQSHLYVVCEKTHLDAYKGILTAMHTGKLIIAPRKNGIEEHVVHKKAGFVIEPNNPEVLAQMIINVYNNQEWLDEMGAYSYHHVKKQSPYLTLVKRFFQLLHL